MALFFLIYRYMFGGAIHAGNDPVRRLPRARLRRDRRALLGHRRGRGAIAEDLEQGFVDRLRSLPIPRSSVLAARAIADTAILTWASASPSRSRSRSASACTAALLDGLAAFGLVVLFGFAFEWLFVAMGLLRRHAAGRAGHGDDRVPARRSSRAPTCRSPRCRGWLQAVRQAPAAHVHGRRRPRADAGARTPRRSSATRPGTSSSRALAWAAAILAVSVPLAGGPLPARLILTPRKDTP